MIKMFAVYIWNRRRRKSVRRLRPAVGRAANRRQLGTDGAGVRAVAATFNATVITQSLCGRV